jgi:hypothetical protein
MGHPPIFFAAAPDLFFVPFFYHDQIRAGVKQQG